MAAAASALGAAFGIAAKALIWLRGVFLMMARAMLANPILLVIAAIALLAAGVYLIYRNWGAISAWFAGVWERIKDFCGAALVAAAARL